ncbi:hypothetical protein BDZ91DRAFT_787439 [Kalaharituber pfeilii]|nr:hypothetical protein BDZ91DRAFT_787439 [Kalaharituber pfeilii]
MAASVPDKTDIPATGPSTTRKGKAPASWPTVVTSNLSTSTMAQQADDWDLDTVSEAGILTPQTGASTPTRNALEFALAGIAQMGSRSDETSPISPELTQIYTGCDEESMILKVNFVPKSSRDVIYAWCFRVAEDKICQSPVLKSALQGWTGTKDVGILRTTCRKAPIENSPGIEVKVLTLTCPIPFSASTSEKDREDLHQQVDAVRDILMALHGRREQIPATYSLPEVEYRVMWAHWFQWVESILTQIRLWLIALEPTITEQLMEQRMEHKEVKSLLNISFILGDMPAFEYFSRRYILTMIPRSATSAPSSFPTLNVYDFVVPIMEIQDHIISTIEDARGKLRKLVKSIVFYLVKSKSVRTDHPALDMKGFVLDWDSLKSRCSLIMLGILLQNLDAEFGHAGPCITSPSSTTESARLWSTPCNFCDGMPWCLAANDSLFQIFEIFQRVVDSVHKIYEQRCLHQPSCTLFLQNIQQTLFTIESEIEGFKLLISQKQIDRILRPCIQSNLVKRQNLVERLEGQAQKLDFSAASKRLEFWGLSGYLRRTWDLPQRSMEVERDFMNGCPRTQPEETGSQAEYSSNSASPSAKAMQSPKNNSLGTRTMNGASHPRSKWPWYLLAILLVVVLPLLLMGFETEQRKFETEQRKFETEPTRFDSEQSKFETERMRFETEQRKLETE